jgi:hypothetical protein
MHHLDEDAHAMKDCSRCGARAFYWRTAIVARDPHSADAMQQPSQRQPAWTCMNCGHIEPHERRASGRLDRLSHT